MAGPRPHCILLSDQGCFPHHPSSSGAYAIPLMFMHSHSVAVGATSRRACGRPPAPPSLAPSCACGPLLHRANRKFHSHFIMGSGTSKPAVLAEALGPDVSLLPLPISRDDKMLFSVIPEDEALKRKGGSAVLLEVGTEGLRLLRPALEIPVGMFPWAQIHSWATSPSENWWFKYFDEGKRSVMQQSLSLRDGGELQRHIKGIIDSILDERKKLAIGAEEFEALLERVRAADAETQLEMIKEAASSNTFSSGQGKMVLELLPTAFDKMEAATVLHSKLVDQNCFSFMLHALECQADRDNVWHRITMMKKQQSVKCC